MNKKLDENIVFALPKDLPLQEPQPLCGSCYAMSLRTEQEPEQEPLVKRIENLLDNMRMVELVPIWNEYCDQENCTDDRVEDMDEFDDLMNGMEPHKIAQMISYGDFNYAHDWFAFDGYGNLISFDCAGDKNSPIDTAEIAKYVVENDEDLYSWEIRDLLNAADREGE